MVLKCRRQNDAAHKRRPSERHGWTRLSGSAYVVAAPVGAVRDREENGASRNVGQQLVHDLGRLAMHPGQHVAVGVEGDRHGGMPEHLGDLLRVDVPA